MLIIISKQHSFSGAIKSLRFLQLSDAFSCHEVQKKAGELLSNGRYLLRNGSVLFKVSNAEKTSLTNYTKAKHNIFGILNPLLPHQVYCHMTDDDKGWTLVARFSNSDDRNWMKDTGFWWYDQQVAMGTTTDPSKNADMISPAFWMVSGREFKITRSDYRSHTPLLQTTGNCLEGQTFRSKIASYGDYRNGKTWTRDKCLGNCTVQ